MKFFALAMSTAVLATPLLYAPLPADAISAAFCPKAIAGYTSLAKSEIIPPGTSELGKMRIDIKASDIAIKLFTKLASLSPGAKPKAALLNLATAYKSDLVTARALAKIAPKYETDPNDPAVRTAFRNDLNVMAAEIPSIKTFGNKVTYWLQKLCPNP
jgi:hypothetical protein